MVIEYLGKEGVSRFKERLDEYTEFMDGGSSYIEEYTFLSSGWDSSGEYSLEDDYPSSEYDIWEISPSNDNTTSAMLSAWQDALIYGYNNTNAVLANGSVPSIDITMSLLIRKKNGKGGTQKPKIVTFADGTDAEIKAMLDAYYNNEITWKEMGWSIGDTRTIHFNAMSAPNGCSVDTWSAQDITIVIVAHDHSTLATPINGHDRACITVQTREVMNNASNSLTDNVNHIYINGDSEYDMTFTKWANLYLRSFLNSIIFGAIPDGDFKSAIKATKHYRHTNYNDAVSEQLTDTLFLPSFPEVYSNNYTYYNITNPTEGFQFEYYFTAANRIKYGNNNGASNGVAVPWWSASASKSYSSNRGYKWLYVTASGAINSGLGNYCIALSPAWGM